MFGIRFGLLAREAARSIGKSNARRRLIFQDLSNRIAPQEAAFVSQVFGLARFIPLPSLSHVGPGFQAGVIKLSEEVGRLARLQYRVRQISIHVTLFERQGASETVVVFGGNGGGPGMETWKFLAILHSTQLSYLVIHRRGTFENGIPGLGDSALDLLVHIREICSSLKLNVVGTFGSSGGSLPALYFAAVFGKCKSIAVGPSNPKTSASWQELTSEHPLREAQELRGIMLIGSEAHSDLFAAREVRKVFPQLETKIVEGAHHIPFDTMGPVKLLDLFKSTFKPVRSGTAK